MPPSIEVSRNKQGSVDVIYRDLDPEPTLHEAIDTVFSSVSATTNPFETSATYREIPLDSRVTYMGNNRFRSATFACKARHDSVAMSINLTPDSGLDPLTFILGTAEWVDRSLRFATVPYIVDNPMSPPAVKLREFPPNLFNYLSSALPMHPDIVNARDSLKSFVQSGATVADAAGFLTLVLSGYGRSETRTTKHVVDSSAISSIDEFYHSSGRTMLVQSDTITADNPSMPSSGSSMHRLLVHKSSDFAVDQTLVVSTAKSKIEEIRLIVDPKINSPHPFVIPTYDDISELTLRVLMNKTVPSTEVGHFDSISPRDFH